MRDGRTAPMGGRERGMGRGTSNDVRTDRWMCDGTASLYVLEMSTAKVLEMGELSCEKIEEGSNEHIF